MGGWIEEDEGAEDAEGRKWLIVYQYTGTEETGKALKEGNGDEGEGDGVVPG